MCVGLKNQNVYYWKRKSKAIEHDLLINRFYIELLNKKDINIKEFKREHRIILEDFTVISDAYILIEYKGVESEYLLELDYEQRVLLFALINDGAANDLDEQSWYRYPDDYCEWIVSKFEE